MTQSPVYPASSGYWAKYIESYVEFIKHYYLLTEHKLMALSYCKWMTYLLTVHTQWLSLRRFEPALFKLQGQRSNQSATMSHSRLLWTTTMNHSVNFFSSERTNWVQCRNTFILMWALVIIVVCLQSTVYHCQCSHQDESIPTLFSTHDIYAPLQSWNQ